jgi:glycosyltransferase involved in cell wall biosynthesis
MTRHRVLLITYYFPPQAAVAVHRMIGLVRHLPRLGWEPTVLAPPSTPWEPTDETLLARVPPGTEVVSVPFPCGGVYRLIRRLAPEAAWLPRAARAANRVVRRLAPDMILTSGPPHCVHRLGLYLRRRWGLPWVADFRDAWVAGGRPAREVWRHRLGRRWETATLREASALLANTPAVAAALRSAYGPLADKVMVAPNGFDPEDFPASAAAAAPAEGPRTLLHAGELYGGRDPRPLLDALCALQSAGPGGAPLFRLRLLGRSTGGAFDVEAEVQRRGLAGVVEVTGQVVYRQALAEMAHADVLLVVTAPPQDRVGIPAKLYEYFGAGRPVLALAQPEGDVAWALRTSGLTHRITPADDAAGISQALRELHAELHGGIPAPAAAESPFTRAAMSRRVGSVLDACLQPAKALTTAVMRAPPASAVQPGIAAE